MIETGHNLPKERVREALWTLDPEGVNRRRERRLLRRSYYIQAANHSHHIGQDPINDQYCQFKKVLPPDYTLLV